MIYPLTEKKIREQLARNVFPSADFRIQDEKQGTLERTLGLQQIIPSKKILVPNQLFDLASLTKVVGTTSLILLMMQENLIDIDLPFNHYYPYFKDSKVTIRHLLTHTSDINPWIEGRDKLNASELRLAYHSLKSGDKIGKEVKYTDTGTVLLGFMLEELYGKDVQTLFKEKVLNPLEMHETQFQPVEPKEKAVPTQVHPIRGLIQGETHDPKAFVLGKHAGSAGMFSNIHDLQKFAMEMLQPQKIFTKETIQFLLQDQTGEAKLGRSLGWDLKKMKDGVNALFHTGYTGTFILIIPSYQISFIFLSNRVHPNDERASYIRERDDLIQCFINEVESCRANLERDV